MHQATESNLLKANERYERDAKGFAIAYTSQAGALTTEQLSYRNGYLTEVHLADGTLVYRHDEENALGQLTKLTSGEMQRSYAFNDWGLPVRRSISRADHTVMFDYSYRFNAENNNLLNRTDETRGLSEDFSYDALNRLSTYGNNAVDYDNQGNIRWKGDTGELAYTNPNRPYTVTGLTPVDDNLVKSGLDITYAAGERPSVITQGAKKAVLTYNANHDRIRMQYAVNDINLLTRYYLGGNYELDVDSTGIQERLYLGGSYYDAPAVWVKQDGSSSVYFIHRDYLGSILQIADVQGNIVEENNFDAWGQRRDPSTHNAYNTADAPKLMLGRGFTGHEHLPMFGLINMNARLYDPVLGRFLSPDPYVQMLDYTQAFNRYSYCMNSPLCYVDENGEIWWIVAAAVIGGAINVAVNWKNIDNFSQGLAYFGVGAAAGALGAVTGGAAVSAVGLGGVAGGAIGGFVGGATSGFVLGFGNTLVGGGNVSDAWSNSLNGALNGAITGTVAGGLIGGGMSFVKGENVWTGRDIAPGRNAFSLKNTPIDNVGRHRPTMLSPDKMPEVAPVDMSITQNGIRNYSVTTYGSLNTNPMLEGTSILPRTLQIKGYNNRVNLQKDLYHDFPRSFDEQIINEGWLYGTSGNSRMMVAPGTVNGTNGIYTIGINSETGIIYHRNFYEWNDFLKSFHFPVMPY